MYQHTSTNRTCIIATLDSWSDPSKKDTIAARARIDDMSNPATSLMMQDLSAVEVPEDCLSGYGLMPVFCTVDVPMKVSIGA